MKLGAYPWFARWELFNLKGIEDCTEQVPAPIMKRSKKAMTPWNEEDLMKQYRSKINEEDAKDIMSQVQNKLHAITQEHQRKKLTVKKGF